jgi:oligopeptide/dipeptide ABC transporter ATP-binding protein
VSALLEIHGLTLELATPHGPARVVEGLDLAVDAGETVALVGESGCGKSLTVQALFGALPPAVRVVAGQAWFRGRELLALPARERRSVLGRELALSFQEPAAAFDPVVTVGAHVGEVLMHHLGLGRAEAARRALERLAEAGLGRVEDCARRLPSELSGGERQRAMLALALALDPALLVADEPTSALDAPLSAEILAFLGTRVAARGMGLLLVTHDLSVVAELADRVAVLYAGRIVEEGAAQALFEHPRHPYTQGLLAARLGAHVPGRPLATIPGNVPAPGRWPEGCPFHPRCPRAEERCRHDVPRLLSAPSGARPSEAPARPDVEWRPVDLELELSSRRVACHVPLEERGDGA